MSRFSISGKILVGFLAIVVMFSSAAVFSVRTVQDIREELRLLHRGYLRLARQSTQIRTLQDTKDAYVRRAMGEENPDVQRHLITSAPQNYSRILRDRIAEMAVQGNMVAAVAGPRDQDFIERLNTQIKAVEQFHTVYDEATNKLLENLRSSQRKPPIAPEESAEEIAARERAEDEQFLLLAEAYERQSEAMSREVRTLSVSLESKIDDGMKKVDESGQRAMILALNISGVALLISLLIAWILRRTLRPLKLLLESARAVGRGELDVELPVHSGDEVGLLADEFRQMIDGIRDRERALASRNDELLRLKHFSDDVIRSVRIGIVILDANNRVLSLNPAARSVFHLPLVDLAGRDLREIDEIQEALTDVLARVDDVRSATELQTFPLLQLNERVVDVALAPMRDRTGAPLAEILLLGEDVSNREETRERLVRSERLAAIGRLAAQITHEIRNPLSSISLNMELLDDDVPFLPEERQEEASSILKQVGGEVDRLTQITEGYLRYAKLPTSEHKEGDVGDLLADLCAFSQSDAHRAGVMLELQVNEGLSPVPNDPQRLRQAVLNLLKNAQEAAGEGGTVRVSAQETAEFVNISVEDTGPGIPDETKQRLFEPFFTTKEKGTGLGLTLTREIVSEHGGSLEIADSVLGGAQFTISLPKPA